MSQRRFTDKPGLDPEFVRSLACDHAAMVENRSLFPTTVVEVNENTPDRILVSGANNRKIGAEVEKGIRRSKRAPEARAKFSKLLRDRWQDPELRKKYLRSSRENSKKGADAVRGVKQSAEHVQKRMGRATPDIKGERNDR